MSERLTSSAAGLFKGSAAFVVSGAASTALAASWYPLRSSQSNVEPALGLIIVAALAGASRRRAAVAGAVTMAALSFIYFDTEPYERFQIYRTPDVITALLLVIVGLMTGEMTRRIARAGKDENSAATRLHRVQDAASRVARGEELAVLANAVAGELEALLPGTDECWFSTDPLPDGTVEVGRGGDHGAIPASASASASIAFALPVWALGRVIGYYLARPAVALAAATPEQLLTATALADQVGAAFAVQVSLPPIPPGSESPEAGPVPALRVLRDP